jgi:hypothetical protein
MLDYTTIARPKQPEQRALDELRSAIILAQMRVYLCDRDVL